MPFYLQALILSHITTNRRGALCFYLKFSVLVHILSPLSVQDELCFVGNTHNMILHGVAQKSDEGVRNTGKRVTKMTPPFRNKLILRKRE